MGDCCYMQITCRRQDQKRFEELGFHLEFDESPNSHLVELIDEEANYAHYNSLPTDIPYHGDHGAGGEYGSYDLACDGQTYAEVETGHAGEFVIDWDETTRQPTPKSLQRIRQFFVVIESARKQLTATTSQPTPG